MYVIISKPDCPWCEKAKRLLQFNDQTFSEYSIAEFPIFRDFLRDNGLTTVPQIFWEGHCIGGYADLEEWLDDSWDVEQ